MRAPAASRPATALFVTATICLTLIAGLVWGLSRWTIGFEVWTFEGRRQVQLEAGRLHAPAVALRGIGPQAPRLWGAVDAAPAAYLVDFIFTRCISICRALGSEYEQMQRELAARQGVRPALASVHLVSMSFDVANDDTAALARYAAQLHADPRRWTFAVPATPGDATTLLRSLGVVVVPDGQGGFVHNGAIHLLDERGRLRGLYEFDRWPEALAAAERLAAAHGEGF